MTTLQGVVKNHTPQILAENPESGVLVLKSVSALEDPSPLLLTVDTGFTGGISLPEERLDGLSLDFLGYVSYVLADGQQKDMPTFAGRVRVDQEEVETRFLAGQPLLGVEFMETVFSSLLIEFKSGEVTLS